MQSGLLAEFRTPEELVKAVYRLRGNGLLRVDCFTPWPVPEVDEALELPPSRVNLVTLIGGLTGATVAYLIQWWTNAYDYPLIVGSRPPHAALAFVPITFETTVLFAGFSALFSMLAFSRLPELWNPVFEVEGFNSASIDRFWLGVDRRDARFNADTLTRDLRELGALQVKSFGESEP